MVKCGKCGRSVCKRVGFTAAWESGCSGVAKGSGNAEVRVKREPGDVALAATAATSEGSGPQRCWRCGKIRHVKAFCTEKPLHGQFSNQANLAMGVTESKGSLHELLDGEW